MRDIFSVSTLNIVFSVPYYAKSHNAKFYINNNILLKSKTSSKLSITDDPVQITWEITG